MSSYPLPGEMANGNKWQTGMVQCASDGSIIVVRGSRHELLKFGSNGAVLGRIDVAGVAGLGEAEVVSFAPGPNGETYVLASHVTLLEAKRSDPNKPPLQRRIRDTRPTFLRFDASAKLIVDKRLPAFEMPWIAVFDSGDFLVFDPPWDHPASAMIYSSDGNLLKQIDLTPTALGPQSKHGPNDTMEAYAISDSDSAFLVLDVSESEGIVHPAAVATVSSKGEVLGSAVLKTPKGYTPDYPRRVGEHLFAQLRLNLNWAPDAKDPQFVELDTATGELVRKYYYSGTGAFLPACNTASGMSFFNMREQTLDVMTFSTQEDH